MAATSSTRLFLHSLSSSPAAPSVRALSRLFCSSQGKSGSSMAVVDSAAASSHSKVHDEKLPEWSLYESAWFGRRWWMIHEFEAVRNQYPKIPVEKVDTSMIWRERQFPKPFGFLNINLYSVISKARRLIMKRTMLVMGRDVKQLEASVERRNKFRSLLTGLKDLI